MYTVLCTICTMYDVLYVHRTMYTVLYVLYVLCTRTRYDVHIHRYIIIHDSIHRFCARRADGMVNLDFEDLKSIVQSGAGVAMIGLGSARGPGRADAATMEALHSPLLDLDMSDARGALINVVGGASLTLGEAERCSQLIKEQISPNAKIIWGAAVKEELGDELRVMLVLTGVKSDQIHGSTENRQLRALRSRQIEFVN